MVLFKLFPFYWIGRNYPRFPPNFIGFRSKLQPQEVDLMFYPQTKKLHIMNEVLMK